MSTGGTTTIQMLEGPRKDEGLWWLKKQDQDRVEGRRERGAQLVTSLGALY